LESDTQTPEDAARQEASGEIWGRIGLGNRGPKVKAYNGPLPDGDRGIEFETQITPDPGCPPWRSNWSGPREGVEVVGDVAKIKVVIRKNTQRYDV
jgi:hypothetical protein